MRPVIRLRCRFPFDPWTCSCCGRRVEGMAPRAPARGLACEDCLDAGRHGEPFIPLTVRMVEPAKRVEDRPIVAVSTRDGLCAVESGETFDLPGLVERVRDRAPGEDGGTRYGLPEQLPPAIVVTDDALDLLGYLDQSNAAAGPFWQWQVSISAHGSWRPEARSKPRTQFLIPRPVRFGYASRRGSLRRKHGGARWYLLLAPTQFCELPDGWPALDVPELLRFGIQLREWSNLQRLPVGQSISAYGGRLLRDARFGGGWRRRVPAATNAALRRRLPGNHYQLLGRVDLTYPEVHKFDQAAAHHHAALTARFPHPDGLQAHGWYRRPPPANGQRVTGAGAVQAGSREWRALIKQPGVFVVASRTPALIAADPLTIPAGRGEGLRWRTVTSGELTHLRALEARVGDIWCCWTSDETDDRLNEYAWWALKQTAPEGTSKWLKPLLLAPYGMLAARPRQFRNGWRWTAKPAAAVGWPTRHGHLIGIERVGAREREPQTTNVLWRAIIEAEVRQRSLTFAQLLRARKLRPIAVYADAVFAVGRFELAGVPAPWRYEGVIHELEFDSPARYRAVEETRLPGTPRGRDLKPGRGAGGKAIHKRRDRRGNTHAASQKAA